MADIHVNIDLETLSTRPDAHLISVGAAAYVDGQLETFHAYVNEQGQEGRHVSPETLQWWREQNQEAQDRIVEGTASAKGLEQVLRQFSLWYAKLGTDRDRLYPWGNGAGFDIAILEHAFASKGLTTPWQFWTARDLRTVKYLAQSLGANVEIEREGVHHDARDDAVHQLKVCHACLDAIYALQPESADAEPS